MRVLRILTRVNLGGPARQAIALWHAQRALGVRTLLAAGEVGSGEVELPVGELGVPEVTLAEVAKGACEGLVRVPGLRPGIAPWQDQRARAALRQLLHLAAPQVVHTHTSKAGWLGRGVARGAGAVIAHTFHGLVLQDYFGPLGSWWLARMERRLARDTELLFAVSESCAGELAAAGIAARERIHVAHPAVALPELLPRAAVRAAFGIGATECCAVLVGRMVPIKRAADFAQAIALAPRWRGIAVGDGPARLMASERLAVLPSDPAIASKLAGFDALVLPSRREGMPLVAIEAFAAGLPVIGYDVPGVRDAVALGGGLLVPETQGPAGLARALAELTERPDLRRELAARGTVAAKAFAPQRLAEQLFAAYQSRLRA